jgi:cytochrome c oxidase assembly factor CtaG
VAASDPAERRMTMDQKDIILTVTGVFNLTFALVQSTTNWKAAMLYKVAPFFTGLACLYAAWML